MVNGLTLDSETRTIVDSPIEKKHFAIIGTREPDRYQEQIAFNLACAISSIGNCIINTGAAHGIDERAMQGTRGGNLKVFLPWKTYNLDLIPKGTEVVVYDPSLHKDWSISVTNYHPNPSNLSRSAWALHARNYGIIEGCSGVIALPNVLGTGGTGQGIRIAKSLKIPVIQINKGEIQDSELMARLMGNALQKFGFADSSLRPILMGKQN